MRAPRSRFRAAVDCLLLLTIASTPCIAQTPTAPRQLLSAREETQLLSVLNASGRRTYNVYRFELGGRFDRARSSRWNGLLLLPQTDELGPTRQISVPTPDGAKSIHTVYHHPDGTMSKLVVDPAGRTVGVASVRGISAWVQLDLDRDEIVDFHRVISLDGNETIAASVPAGAAFLERWRLGDMALCSSNRSRERDESSFPGAKPTIPLCGQSQSQRGPLSGITSAKSTEAVDPMDRMCVGRGGSATLPGSVSPRAEQSRAAQDIVIADGWKMLLGAPKTGEATAPGDEGAGATVRRDPPPAPPPTAGGPPPAPPGGGRKAPVPGSEGVRSGDSEAALDALCAQRARANRRWTVTLSALEKNQSGATDTNCDDPVTDPAAADARKSVPKCGPSRESQSVSQQLLAGLGAYEARQCGKLEQPGPDGTCRGGRTIGSNRARLWYGWGNVIGLIPCDGVACDPKENP